MSRHRKPAPTQREMAEAAVDELTGRTRYARFPGAACQQTNWGNRCRLVRHHGGDHVFWIYSNEVMPTKGR